MRHAETSRELRAVAVVAIEELDHSRRPPGSADPLFDPFNVERIDEPDGALYDERVRRPLEKPRFLPPEPAFELVTGPEVHGECPFSVVGLSQSQSSSLNFDRQKRHVLPGVGFELVS
jgi:hypothetical protein